MGGSFSGLNKFGLPGLPRITSATTKQVYDNHFKDTATFEEFHIAYVEFCKYFNTLMPGQDFDTPSREQIKEFYEKWSKEDSEGKKVEFFKFIEREIHEDPRDDKFFIMAGLAAPAAAVIGKRASKHIPYVKNVRLDLVPNVVFVPVVTLGAIILATAAEISSKSEAKKDSDKAKKDSDEDKKGSGEDKKGST